MVKSGTLVGRERYQLRREIGSGGMGVVYEALDRVSGTIVALKTIHSDDVHAMYRLKNEFRYLQDIEHPNLVALGDLVQDENGQWMFTMELVEGEDFINYVRPRHLLGSFDEQRLRNAFGQLVLALDALHQHGKIHRDVKPSNVLVTSEGRTVLLDFGLATSTRPSMQSVHNGAVGTAPYMAPEQAASRAVGPPSDLYAAGAMLYEALTGEVPFQGSALHVLMKKQFETPERPSRREPRVPKELEELCMQLLCTVPEDRPRASDVLRSLGISVETFSRTSTRLSTSEIMLGREGEWAKLERALDTQRKGQPCALLITGESGLGKTTLVRSFAEYITGTISNSLVLSGRCYQRELAQYKGFDSVVDELASHLRSLPSQVAGELVPRSAYLLTRMFPVLARVPAIARTRDQSRIAPDRHELRTRAFAVLRELLGRVAGQRLITIVLEDLQWADADSLGLLSELACADDAPPIMFLLTARASSNIVDTLCHVFGKRLVQSELKALDVKTAEQLALAQITRLRPRSSGMARDIARESAGHPLYLTELVHYACFVESPSERIPRLEDAIFARVQRLSATAFEVLRVLSLAAGPLSVDLLSRAADLERQECVKHLSALRVAHLTRWTADGLVEPFHEGVRETLRNRIERGDAQVIHARLVAALETEIEHPEMLMHHLEAVGDVKRAATLAAQAAERAAEALAFDHAVHLYRFALERGGFSEEERTKLKLGLGHALIATGRAIEGAESYLNAAEDADPEAKRECMRLAASHFVAGGDIERGLSILEQVLASVNVRLPRTPRAAMASMIWHRTRLYFRGMAWKERREGQVSREQRIFLDIHRTVAQGLALVDNLRGADFNARFLLHALNTGEPTRLVQAFGTEAAYLGQQGGKQLARGRQIYGWVEALAEKEATASARAWALTVDGGLAYFEARFCYAAEVLGRAMQVYRDDTHGVIWESNVARTFRLFALRHSGQFAAARAVAREDLSDARRCGDGYLETLIRRYCTFLYLADGDPEGAERNMSSSTWVPQQGHFHLQNWYELEAHAELMLYRDQVTFSLSEIDARFAELENSLVVGRVQTLRVISRWLKARLCLASQHGADREPRLARAQRIAHSLEREQVGYATCFARLTMAAVEVQRGRSSEALVALEQAIEMAERLGMRVLRECARFVRGQWTKRDGQTAMMEKSVMLLRSYGVSDVEGFVRVVAPAAAAST
jgi:serine/threonine protein kinase